MDNIPEFHINISAPNLVTLCVDSYANGEMSGRLFHCYEESPRKFGNVVQLIAEMECFYDAISFPQASTQTRYFIQPEKTSFPKLKKRVEQKELIRHRGEKGSFIIIVKYRQNSAWQGEIAWIEGGVCQNFSSTLECIRIIDQALKP